MKLETPTTTNPSKETRHQSNENGDCDNAHGLNALLDPLPHSNYSSLKRLHGKSVITNVTHVAEKPEGRTMRGEAQILAYQMEDISKSVYCVKL